MAMTFVVVHMVLVLHMVLHMVLVLLLVVHMVLVLLLVLHMVLVHNMVVVLHMVVVVQLSRTPCLYCRHVHQCQDLQISSWASSCSCHRLVTFQVTLASSSADLCVVAHHELVSG